jgi:flagellar hook-length control protein FliK
MTNSEGAQTPPAAATDALTVAMGTEALQATAGAVVPSTDVAISQAGQAGVQAEVAAMVALPTVAAGEHAAGLALPPQAQATDAPATVQHQSGTAPAAMYVPGLGGPTQPAAAQVAGGRPVQAGAEGTEGGQALSARAGAAGQAPVESETRQAQTAPAQASAGAVQPPMSAAGEDAPAGIQSSTAPAGPHQAGAQRPSEPSARGDSPAGVEQNSTDKQAGATGATASAQRPSTGEATQFSQAQAHAAQIDPAAPRAPEVPQARPAPATTDGAETPSPATQVLRTLAEKAPVDGQTVTIRLNPPEMGRVSVTFQAEGRELKAIFEADNPRTLGDLRREAAGLVGSLNESGVQLRRVEFVVTDGASNQQNSTAHNWQFQEGQGWSQNPGATRQAAQFAETLFDDAEAATATAATDETFVADGQLNVWA